MARDMARVVTLKSVAPLLGKDRIVAGIFEETAFECIIPKETANIGDLYIMFEADSILPVKPEFEFLRKRSYSEKLNGFLIKAMKMGQKEDGTPMRSWALCMKPEEVGLSEDEIKKLKSGQDLTERLEVRKNEPLEDASPKGAGKKAYPAWVKFCLSHVLTRWIGRIWQSKHQNVAGGFPDSEVTRSDETTIQNMPVVLESHADDKVYITAKMEGQSATTAFDVIRTKSGKIKKVGKFYVCSRNNAYKLKCNNDFWETAVKLDVERKLRDYYKKTGKLLILQCEQVGPNIQNNIYNFKSTKWYVYLAEDMVAKTQLTYDELVAACKDMGLDMVPVVADNIALKDVMPNVETAITYAEKSFWKLDKDGNLIMNYEPKDNEKLWRDYFQNEGVVVRSIDCDKLKNKGFSFKVKNLGYSEQGLGNIANSARKLIK